MFVGHSAMVPGQYNHDNHAAANGRDGQQGGANILVVDDTTSAREPLARLLRLAGYETAVAADGGEALVAMARRLPDLVLLDLMMPRVDGLSFLRQMRSDPKLSRVPVILITAADAADELAAARGLGVQGCMLKAAFTVPELLERIAKTLKAN
jgi:two-component system response regulator MprA